ncbi:MAG: decarboxylating NADP(+)-dependent phosphogluconate dehydrogenase, partial [Verrucomicrobiota bacterium]|nr:decarboxylating NADP(+)-dependent phosphogluconate dehydrogenase [Verrucomicrobiota bacterium]
SHYKDSSKRYENLKKEGIHFVGAGISGGEEGALNGPSIMPGGSAEAWPEIQTIFNKIAAKTSSGEVCCNWVGSSGSGHFVKMVHNGIEYGDMQMICEAYHIMRFGLNLSNDEIADVFDEWNKSELNSYLIEITKEILRYENEDGERVVDLILDSSGQKGTGKWTARAALDYGQPLSLIAEAVFARCLSSFKEERVEAAKSFTHSEYVFNGDKKLFVDNLKQALYASKIISYTQGFQLLKAASNEYKWDLNLGEIALLWRGGCIIRSVFLNQIKNAYDNNNHLSNLLMDPFFNTVINESQDSWRAVMKEAISFGIPTPAMSSALAYFDGYKSEKLPSNLLQAQRDYFGAHTYERIDKDRGLFFHTNWTGKGGQTSSSSYQV